MSRLQLILTAAIATVCATGAGAQSVYPDPAGGASTSLYQDWKPNRAGRVGDILTVLITETTSATNTSNLATSKENTTAISNQKGTGKLSRIIPAFGLTSDASTEFTGEGSISRSQQISARVSVTVVSTKPNGDLVVEGSRTIEINGEKEVVHVTGAVNPRIIPANNTIESYRMSDLQVSYKGRGVVSEGSRPGVLIRVLNWIF